MIKSKLHQPIPASPVVWRIPNPTSGTEQWADFDIVVLHPIWKSQWSGRMAAAKWCWSNENLSQNFRYSSPMQKLHARFKGRWKIQQQQLMFPILLTKIVTGALFVGQEFTFCRRLHKRKARNCRNIKEIKFYGRQLYLYKIYTINFQLLSFDRQF